MQKVPKYGLFWDSGTEAVLGSTPPMRLCHNDLSPEEVDLAREARSARESEQVVVDLLQRRGLRRDQVDPRLDDHSDGRRGATRSLVQDVHHRRRDDVHGERRRRWLRGLLHSRSVRGLDLPVHVLGDAVCNHCVRLQENRMAEAARGSRRAAHRRDARPYRELLAAVRRRQPRRRRADGHEIQLHHDELRPHRQLHRRCDQLSRPRQATLSAPPGLASRGARRFPRFRWIEDRTSQLQARPPRYEYNNLHKNLYL